mmetsp:Transcript_12134/g.30869  ORF Transcript_12134/g.30869 Transcript_12134/m.30869 type:complete len:383 (+) Transcript_12134:208-1356(+)
MGDDLPEGWERAFSRSQKREYFHHPESGKSVWRIEDLPQLDALLRAEKTADRRSRGDSVLSAGSASLTAAAHDESELHSAKRRRTSSGDDPEGGTNAATAADPAPQEGPSDPRKRPRRVCVIVPFRDQHAQQHRSAHLKAFVPHMEKFLSDNPSIERHHVLVVEQSEDGRKFNRGKLLNIGFKYATEVMRDERFDSFIFHDVDLLPQKPLAEWYARFPDRPLHIARCWGRYNNNEDYFGGIVAFNREDFTAIDGFPNTYWGWGGEDDELQLRVQAARISVAGPPRDLAGAVVDLENMNLKAKLQLLRKTDWKCNVKWEARDEYKNYRAQSAEIPWWGLSGIKYDLEKVTELGEHASKVTVNVRYNFNSDGSDHWANHKLTFQ